jgi:hypothetical protein
MSRDMLVKIFKKIGDDMGLKFLGNVTVFICGFVSLRHPRGQM